MRVAFTLIGGKDWAGGHNYLLNLLTVLATHLKGDLTPVLFVSDGCIADDIAAFSAIPGLELVSTSLLNSFRQGRSIAQAVLLGRDSQLSRLFRAYHIDVVFESARFFGWRLGIPAIAWIPDFQHKALSHLFPRRAWLKREMGFRAQVIGNRAIMLSSDDARRACETYYPSTRGRTWTIPFAVPPGPKIDLAEARAIADSYGLPEHFFFMPNQFWRHKNHGLVLDALTILRQRGVEVVIAASGKQLDPRDPDYFPTLKAKVERNRLGDTFRLIGMVPYDHVSMLMRACSALINPSLFEGWSTTVEEARLMGAPMVLSDINVHKEQMPSNALFFDRHSAEALANALCTFIPLTERERAQRVEIARIDCVKRTKRFADAFFSLVKMCRRTGGGG